MLRFLLAEQISPDVAYGLAMRQPKLEVLSLVHWQSGEFLANADEVILKAASKYGLTLVTFDLTTIAPLVKAWSEQGRIHAGVIFVDDRSIRPNDFGGLIYALEKLWIEKRLVDWTNYVEFLRDIRLRD